MDPYITYNEISCHNPANKFIPINHLFVFLFGFQKYANNNVQMQIIISLLTTYFLFSFKKYANENNNIPIHQHPNNNIPINHLFTFSILILEMQIMVTFNNMSFTFLYILTFVPHLICLCVFVFHFSFVCFQLLSNSDSVFHFWGINGPVQHFKSAFVFCFQLLSNRDSVFLLCGINGPVQHFICLCVSFQLSYSDSVFLFLG